MTIFLLSIIFLGVSPPPDSTARLMEYHLLRYPHLRVQDAYKMLYQGEFGIGHLLGDGQGARRYLLEELATMDTADRGEELLEPVSPDGEMVRVNLRPFRRLGHSPEALLGAMLATVAETKGDTARFVSVWDEFARLARNGPFSAEELRAWDERVRRRDLPVAHHSPEYVREYLPAYRVCRRSAIRNALSSGGEGAGEYLPHRIGVRAARGPAAGHQGTDRGGAARRPPSDPAGGHGERQDLHDLQRHCRVRQTGPGDVAQQDPCRPALQRIQRVLPEGPGGILHQLLRLLPARGVRPVDRHVHRQRREHQ